MKTFAMFMLTTALAAGCSETELIDSPPEPIEDAPLVGTLWNLTELDGETIELPDTRVPYLRFEAESVSGYDGCNHFSGSYIVSGDALSFVDLMSTLVECLDIMELQFLSSLGMTNRYDIVGNQLHLFEDEQLLMSFIVGEQM